MKKLEKLTQEQKDIMIETRDFWINKFWQTKEIDKEKFETGIEWLYNDLLGKDKPKIIYCDSWISCLITISVLKNNMDSVRSSVRASVSDSVIDSVRASVSDSVWDSVRASVSDSVRASVSDSVSDSVWASVSDSVWDSVWDCSNYISSYSNYDWASYYDYFSKINIVKNEKFNKYKDLILSGVFQCYEYENYVFAIQPPEIKINSEGNSHSIDGYAYEFKDKSGGHIINGKPISETLFKSVKNKTLTTKEFFEINNEETKSVTIEMMQLCYGDEYVANFFSESLTEFDTYVDKKKEIYLEDTTGMNVGVYTLFKGNINNTEIAYVRCYCPSTDRMFYLGVHPDINNAKDAISSLYRVPKKLKDNIKYIQRQGERFCTVFNEDGMKKLRNLEKNDIADTVSISGDEYFSKMTYEY
jgi:hypothetical protein